MFTSLPHIVTSCKGFRVSGLGFNPRKSWVSSVTSPAWLSWRAFASSCSSARSEEGFGIVRVRVEV